MHSLRFLANMLLAGLVALSIPWAVHKAEMQFPQLGHVDLPEFDSPVMVLLVMAAVGLFALRRDPESGRRA